MDNMKTTEPNLLRCLSDLETLESSLDQIRESPADNGVVQLIVRRPAIGEREVLAQGDLSLEEGLVGDGWLAWTKQSKYDEETNLGMQVTIMNARAIALIAQTEDRWPLAGDQFYVDLDLSQDNLPAGTRLKIGSAVVEVSAVPHTGCKLFAQRYGTDSVQFVNSPVGKQLRLRGLNARVIRPGTVRVGDSVKKIVK
jgi:hypothetical protein